MLDTILVSREYPLAATFGLDPKEVDPSISVSGFEIPDPANLSDPDARRTAEFLRGAVPVADPMYRFRKDLVRDLFYWWGTGGDEVMMFWGPTGSGKTSIFTEWCARLGVPLFIGKGHRGFEPHEAFGHYILAAGGETVWAPGPVTLAAQYGCPVLITRNLSQSPHPNNQNRCMEQIPHAPALHTSSSSSSQPTPSSSATSGNGKRGHLLVSASSGVIVPASNRRGCISLTPSNVSK